ncbi:MAG: hypothetical protein PHH13_00790 [Candidatus Peribacteraceae bacterium]|nr:hypothetical protein [Candidatus Peribacteraceae bacterium]
MKTVQEIIRAGRDVEDRLGCALFPDLRLEDLGCLSIEDLRRCYHREIESIITLHGLLQSGMAPADLSSVVQTISIHGRERPGSRREILGFPVKAIGSNIRRQDIDWNQFTCEQSGVCREGDIVIARALSSRGSINQLEDQAGREVRIFEGDHFMTVMGNRHSGTSEYGELTDGQMELQPDTEVDLLCHGGILGHGICIPRSRAVQTFFKVHVAAILRNGGRNLNLLDLYPAWDKEMLPSAPIIFNCGTSAEIGKTTSSSSIIRALKRMGKRVGAAKLAGTGRYRDLLSMRDAGADLYFDFPDVGLPSTYTSPSRSYPAAVTLLNKLNRGKVDVVVAEMGGDIIEANIPSVLQSPEMMRYANGIVHSSADILGILGSLQRYRDFGVQVPVMLTLPKDRNDAGTRERLQQEHLSAFDVMNMRECDQVVGALLRCREGESIFPV